MVVIVSAGAGYLTRSQPQPATAVVAHGTPGVAGPGDDAPFANVPDASAFVDDGWALIAAVADQVAADEAFAPQVGQAELSISALSADERRALAGELAAELAPGRNREG